MVAKLHALMCVICYEKGHTLPHCFLSPKELHQLVLNYEEISPMERLGIPAASYHKVKKMFSSQDGEAPCVSAREANPPTVGSS